MARNPGSANYLPEEIAMAVIALEEGQSLSTVAAYLGRDRSGLFRALKALGYPTRPPMLDPARRREAVEDAIASIDVLSRREIREQLLELRRQDRRFRPLT
ncbi:MAG: hypothetical protein LC792_26120 [Actinobacteria bacterium]|nr:hypothetical protein [Actinomycetota bacterium]